MKYVKEISYIRRSANIRCFDLFFFPYDWRLNLDNTIELLNDKINEIKAELDKQVIIKKKIEEERNKIELIIEKAVK